MSINTDSGYRLALDGLVREGVLSSWRMTLGPGNHKGKRRTWELSFTDGQVWRVERGTLDAMLAIAGMILERGAA